jgi:hypothetical protein
MLELSTHSSNGTPASVLLASVEFSVVGATLTINITNDTAGSDEYKINEFYFNGPDGVSLTADTLPSQWNFDGAGGITVEGFGNFDFGLTNARPTSHASLITPGETETFSFTIPTGAPTDQDFTTAFSVEDPPGAMPAIIAASFVAGPGDGSAFGATVPTPGVLALMGVAGVVAARPRRRRE